MEIRIDTCIGMCADTHRHACGHVGGHVHRRRDEHIANRKKKKLNQREHKGRVRGHRRVQDMSMHTCTDVSRQASCRDILVMAYQLWRITYGILVMVY